MRVRPPQVDVVPESAVARRRADEQRDAALVLALQRGAGNAAVSRMLQRMVGFEFQCRNWQFYKQSRIRGEVVVEEHDPGRGNSVYDGTGWHLESDGGEPEFVVDAVPEATQSPKNVVGQAANFAKTFKESGRTIDGAFTDPNKKLFVKPKPDTAAESPVTADPQVTAGVRYDRLATFMSVISQRIPAVDKDPERMLTKGNELVQNTAVKHYKQDDLMIAETVPAVRDALTHLVDPRRYFVPSRQLVRPDPPPQGLNDAQIEGVVGLLALLATYLRKAPGLGHALMKDFPLLAKSDLGTAVSNSPLNDWLQAGNTRTTVFGVLEAEFPFVDNELLRVRTALKAVLAKASGRTLGDRVYPPEKNDRNPGPTINEWLDALFSANPRDLLSTRTGDFADRSMGPYNRVDTVGPADAQSRAPIVEMRRIQNTMPQTEWRDFSALVADWLKRLNDPAAHHLDFGPKQDTT